MMDGNDGVFFDSSTNGDLDTYVADLLEPDSIAQEVDDARLIEAARQVARRSPEVQRVAVEWLSDRAPTLARLAAATVFLRGVWQTDGVARPDVVDRLVETFEHLQSRKLATEFELSRALAALDQSRLPEELRVRIDAMRDSVGLSSPARDILDETPTLDIPAPRIASASEEIPFITAAQMREVDRMMAEEFQISLDQMMENAGRNLAALTRRLFLAEDPCDRRVVVLAGKGGNGGGALTAARRLSNWGAKVTVALASQPEEYQGVPAKQLDTVRRMGVRVGFGAPPNDAPDVIVDGVLGDGLEGDPREPAAELIRYANDVDSPVLALDVPSGLELGAETVRDPVVDAEATMTLALPKKGLRAGVRHVGELYLGDISVPTALWRDLGYDVGPIFAESEVVRIW